MRYAFVACLVLLAACGGKAPLEAKQPSPDEIGPKPTATPPDANALPQPPGVRQAALNFQCGGDSIRVAFVDEAHATLINDDGSNTDLPKLPADANSTTGVDVFSSGKVTITHHVANDGSQVVKFARGKMALQDCSPTPK